MTRSASLRRRWTCATLLSGAALTLVEAAAAAAQVAPVPPPPAPTDVPIVVAGGEGGAVIGQSGDTRTVDIGAQSRSIQWQSYNVGSAASVVYSGAAGRPLTVLNSVDAAGGLSQIYGKIVSQPNINVWLSNPNGILFGSSGAYTGGSLVLTTAALGGIDPSAIDSTVAPLASARLADMPAGVGVRVFSTVGNANPDGTATPGTGTGLQVQGNVLIAAQVIEVTGVVRASGAADLITARTVDVALSDGSPIRVNIAEGTTVGRLTIGSSGEVAAANLRVRGASASGSEVLLGIDAGAQLTATAANGRVQIVGQAATDGSTGAVRVESSGTIAGNQVTLQSRGQLADRTGSGPGTVTAGTGGLEVIGTESIDFSSALNTRGMARVFSPGTVALRGAVTADGALSVTGIGIELGAAGTAVSHTVGGIATVDASGGDLVAQSGYRLAAAGGVSLASNGPGGIRFATDVAILAGTADADGRYGGTLTLQPGGQIAAVALGTVDAGRIVLPSGSTSLAGSLTAERLSIRDALTLRSTAGALTLGEVRSFTGGVTLTSDTQAVLADSVQAAGDVAITAGTDIAGRAASASAADGRLLTGFGRTTLVAEPARARIAVTAGGAAQLGDVLAGVGAAGAANRLLDQVVVRAGMIDAATATDAAGTPTQAVRAGQGNLVLASAGALRLGVGEAAAGVESYDAVNGTYGVGVSATGDAQIGTLTARVGDMRLAVGGVLTGLNLPGTVADGLALADGETTGDLRLDAAGDLGVVRGVAGGAATLDAGGNIRIGSVGGGTGLTATADLSVTGLPVGGIAGASAGANLVADTGSILLPPPGAAAGTVAVLGTVSAANGMVSLTAGRLSAQSVTAGGAATLTATGSALAVGTLRASAATLSTGTAATPVDNGQLAVAIERVADTAILRDGFGFADLAVTGSDAVLAVAAGRAAQLGQLTAGQVADGLRAGDQITVTAEATTLRALVAANGGVRVGATAGDLYLGLPGGEAAAVAAAVVQTGGGVTLDKTGTTGILRVAGGLAVGTQAGSAATVTVSSDTDLLGRAITSATGDILLRANGRVAAFASGVVAGGLTIGSGSADTVAFDLAGDVRVGGLTATSAIDVDAGGSVTGLGIAATGPGLDLAATAGVADVRGRAGTLGSAALGTVTARDGITVAANAVSIESAGTGGVLQADAGGTIAATLPFVADDGTAAVERLAPDYGFADLLVTGAGGTLSVTAGGAAQLGQVAAGTGATALADAAGTALAQVGVAAGAVSIDRATATNGGLALTATGGGLYLREGAAGTFATLTKQGATGGAADANANELRVTALAAGTLRATDPSLAGRTLVDSATGLRAGVITAFGNDDRTQAPLLRLTARAGDLSGLAAVTASDGRLLADYARTELAAPDAGARIAIAATGTAQLGGVEAGVAGGGAIDASAADLTINQVTVQAGAIDAAALDRRVAAGQGNIALASGSDLRLALAEAAGGVERYDPATGARGAGLVAAGNAQVGRLVARAGDLRLDVAGVLSGLVLPGTAMVLPAGDGLILADADLGSAAIDGAGHVRIGAIRAASGVSVTAGGDLTGLGGGAAGPVAELFADRGSILLPAGGAPGQAALLGRVEAPLGQVTLAAGRLSVDRLVAGTAALTASDAVEFAETGLLVDANRALRPAYGFADLSTTTAGSRLDVTAGGAAQLGTLVAGDAAAGTIAGTQLSVTADALTIGRAFARNGALLLAARAGDLYLGDQAAGAAGTLVAGAATTATFNKAGGNGLVSVSGALIADGLVAITTDTGLRARAIESRNADVAIRAATLVSGLALAGLPVDRLAEDGLRLATGSVGGEAVLDGGAGTAPAGIDVRIGELTSATRIDIAASGSVTGLAAPDLPISASLTLRAGSAVTVGASAAAARLGSVTVAEAVAGDSVTIDASRIAATRVQSGGATDLTAGAGLSVDALVAGGPALLRADAPASAPAAVALMAEAGVPLAAGFGEAVLTVTGAGISPAAATDLAGTVRVAAGLVAQLGTVTAGTGSTSLVTPDGSPRDQITVGAQALSISRADAANGSLRLDAATGELYLGQGTARLDAALVKRGATDGAADLVRVGTLVAGGALSVASDTSIRGTSLTSTGGDIALTAVREITGAAQVAGPAGLSIGSAALAGDAVIDTAGNLRIGSLTTTGALTLGADGSITGLRAGDAVPAGIDLVAAGRVGVGGVPGATLEQAALGRVVAGSDRDGVAAVQVRAGLISAGSVEAAGRVVLDATRGLAVGAIGAGGLGLMVREGGADVEGTVLATRDDGGDRLAADAGFARLAAGGALGVIAGREDGYTGAAQLGTIRGASVAVTADALTIQRILPTDLAAATATTGPLSLTATRGALYLDSGSASGAATLTKAGANADPLLATRADEVRVSTLSAAQVSVTSATGIRAGDLRGTIGDVALTATGGDVTGLRGAAVASDRPGFAPDWGRTQVDAAMTTAVTASGLAQLGTVTAGVAGSADVAGAPQLAIRAQATSVLSADARNGSLLVEMGTGETSLDRVGARLGAVVRGGGSVRLGELLSQVGDLTVVGSEDVTGLGIASGYGRADLTAQGSGRSVGVTANGLAQLGAVTAGLAGGADLADGAAAQVAVRAQATSVASVAARNGGLLVQTGTGETAIDRGEARLSAEVQGGGSVRLGDLVSQTRDVTVTSGADVTGLGSASGFGRANLTAQGLGRGVTVTADDLAQLGAVTAGLAGGADLAEGAGAQVVARARAADVTSIVARNGGVLVETGAGETSLARGEVRLGARVQGGGAVRIGTLSSQIRDVSVVGGGDVTGLAAQSAADGRLVSGQGRADLAALAEGRTLSVTARGTAQLGVVAAGQGSGASRTANQIAVRAAAVDAANVTATNGNLVLEARTGVVRLGQGVAGGGVEAYDAARQVASSGISGAAGVQIGAVSARTGDVRVLAGTGNVSGLVTPAGTGRADLSAAGADRRIVVEAGAGNALLGTLSAGTDAASAIEQIGVDARAIDVAAATAANGAIGLRASTGALTLGTGTAATSATLTKLGSEGALRIGGALTARDGVTLASTTDVDLGDPVRATAANGTILIDAIGTTPVRLGSAATAGFALTADELNRLDAPTITLDARGNAVTIGNAALGTGGTNTLLRLLTSGDVTLTGTIGGTGSNAAGAARTLQIGGTRAASAVDANGIAQPAELANSLSATLNTGAGIQWAGGTVDLRARGIVFGDGALRREVAASNPAGIAINLVANPNSTLYRSGVGRDFLSARLLQVRYRSYALLQNAGASATASSGVVLNPGGTTTGPVALQLFGPGDTGSAGGAGDSFALFGTINGAVERSAGLLPESVIQFAGGQPRVVRVTQANARVNGCVIGSPDRGCLNVDSPPPLIRLFDERQIQLFGTEENPDILFEPLIGTNNEALVGDLGGVDATGLADCPTGKEPTCPVTTSAPATLAPPTQIPTPAAPEEVKP